MIKLSEVKKIIEAALFMSSKPIPFMELLKLSESALELRKSITELTNFYNSSDSALEITETPAGFQMRVRLNYADKVNHLAAASSEFSSSVMKTLALIAYKQPLIQAELIKYRSNKAYEDVKVLESLGFISREPNQKTFILRTTKKFVEYFGPNPVKLVKHEALKE